LDVASAHKTLGQWVGRKIETMDIGGSPDYKGNIEAACPEVPKKTYSVVSCLNYFLLCDKPNKPIENIVSFLAPNGVALLQFTSICYWYKGGDGFPYRMYNPSYIEQLLTPHFKTITIYPLGNFMQAACNYYAKINPRLKVLINNVAPLFTSWDKKPESAIDYMVLATGV
jgi:hypothetical protein